VDAARLHPLGEIDQTAAYQIRALLGRLPAGGPVPWFVFDARYDSAPLSLGFADDQAWPTIRCCSVVRLPEGTGGAIVAVVVLLEGPFDLHPWQA